jgi:HSP20 family protein
MTKHFLPELFGRGANNPFNSLQREVDRVFSDFGRNLPTFGDMGPTARSLHLNVAETDKDIEVTADVPGVDADKINIELRDDILTISGDNKTEKEEKKKDYHLVELTYGSFQRSVALPCEVDADKVVANFDKGVLKIILPKVPGKQDTAKKITVKAA